ncbi:SUN domain-containing protein 1-like [Anthonomus grandis grandis]|uniref:SUN domain-containing protein 1-like n=1 Tax=Anthonomus grandis grandis TaxID=2921223 RepID=UPI0021654F7C|nr:SUN domain-containing protein 1-like [Anthonomus grandis grandis]
MSMYGDPSLADLLPAYYCNNIIPNRRGQESSSICRTICTHLLTLILAIGICSGGYHYYQNIYPSLNRQTFPNIQNPIADNYPAYDANKVEESGVSLVVENLNKDMENFRNELLALKSWRSTINTYLTKLQWEEDIKISNAIEEALEMHDADGIGLMDYAASYAGGTILEISKDTRPHPTHRPLSFFKIVNVDLLSSPEEVIRPCVLPGSCFAFKSETASIRIRLGKPIVIGGVTLSHASRYLIGTEGMLSAPKDFEVYAYEDRFDNIGVYLGKFTYDVMGKQHQTFKVKSKNDVFEEVELVILSNYGKPEYTCVYRFRVHKKDKGTGSDKGSSTREETTKKRVKKCC